MKKLLSVLLTLSVLCSLTAAVFADKTADAVDAENTVTVGIRAEYAPFEYYENGTLKGFDVELMNLIGEKIGYKVNFVDIVFDALIPSVLSGRVDCAISAISVTEEREALIDFSREYLRTNTVAFENGQISRKPGENYAIVFRSGVSEAKYSSNAPTEYETLYLNIDRALSELSQNGTIGKLIEKHELNKPIDETKENIEYEDIQGCGAPSAKTSAESVPASEWAEESIETAKEINILSGNYNFPGAITREEFCGFIFTYLENIAQIPLKTDSKIPFKDTDNVHIGVLNSMDIIKGKSETEFAPSDFLTREEAATILYRLITKIYPDAATTEKYFKFADSDQISDWAAKNIQVICNMGIMQGTNNNNFAPKSLYTTEQAIATLVRIYNSFVKPKDYTNAENMSYAQIEDLQNSVNNGHFPWRLDYEQVITSFLSGKGENVENGELISFAGDGEKCSCNYRIDNLIYTIELFKPIDKSENGIWIVKTYKKGEDLVSEKFTVLSLPWGEKWENVKDRETFSKASIISDDENRFVVELKNAEFLGATGKMALLFSMADNSFPVTGFVKAYFIYDENDEKKILSRGLETYGERKTYFLDENGFENPLNPPAWFINEYIESSLSASEREHFEKILKDKSIEETRANAIIRGPLVVISVNESENVITIDGNNAAKVFNLRNFPLETN